MQVVNIDWQKIFEIYNEPLFILDKYLNIVECNGKAIETYGYAKNEFLTLNMLDINVKYSWEEIENAVIRSIDENGSLLETLHIKKNGTGFPVEVNTKPFLIENELGYLQLVRDISKRSIKEFPSIQNDGDFHDLVHSSAIAILILSSNKIWYVNPAGVKLFKANDEREILGRSIFDLIHPDYHKVIENRIVPLKEGMTSPLMEGKLVAFDGRLVDFELHANPIAYAGKPAVEIFIQDITIRKKSEEMSSLLALIVESCQDAVIGKTREGIINYWNKSAERIYGYRKEEVMGRSISMLMPDELKNELPFILSKVNNGEHIKHYETSRIKKDGSRVKVSVTVSPLINMFGDVDGASAVSYEI